MTTYKVVQFSLVVRRSFKDTEENANISTTIHKYYALILNNIPYVRIGTVVIC